jgi:hypothetical protein
LMCREFQSKCLLEAGSNGRYDRASGSIRSTQTRRHFANLTGKSSATARDGNPSRSVTTLPSWVSAFTAYSMSIRYSGLVPLFREDA